MHMRNVFIRKPLWVVKSICFYPFIALPLAVLSVVSQPIVGYYFFLFSIFLPFGYIDRFVTNVPDFLRWLPFVFLLLTSIGCAIQGSLGARSLPRSVIVASVAFVFVGLISSWHNVSNPVGTILAFRWLFLIIGSVAVTRCAFGPNATRHLYRIMLYLGLFQIPVTVIQRVGFVGKLDLDPGDSVAGLFLGYPDLVFFQIFCIVIVVSHWLRGQKLLAISPIATLMLLLVPIILSNARAAWIFLPLTLTHLIIFAAGKNILKIAGKLLFLSTVFIIGVLAFDRILYSERPEQSMLYLTDLDYIQQHIFGGETEASELERGRFRRGALIFFLHQTISSSIPALLMGLGPAEVMETAVSGSGGEFYLQHQDLGLNRNSISVVYGGTGLLGAIAVGFLLFGLYRGDKSIHFSYNSPERSTAIFLICLMLIYYNVLNSPVVALTIGQVLLPSRDFSKG